MVTIYDIAKACGVSGATVSKALNGHNDVSKKTKDLIYDTAIQLGYMPNQHARSLITKRSYDIGILFIDESQNGLTHQLFSTILESVRAELEEKGYDISILSSKVNGIQGGYLEHCKYRCLDGVIIACVDFDNEDVRRLIDSNIPVVLIDKEIENKACILSCNYQGTKSAVEYLINKGHQKIGFIHGQPTSTLVTEKRLQAFYDVMKENGLEPNPEWIVEGAYYEWDKTYDKTIKVLSGNNRPTALLLPDDYSALATYQAIHYLDLKIPQDISLIGNDGLKHVDIMVPRLTTVLQKPKEIGKLAAQQLVHLIENKNYKPKIITVPTSLKEGESVVALPQSK